MARYPNATKIYEVASLFADECLFRNGSLLWPDRQVWTIENLGSLWVALVENPDIGTDGYLAKLTGQLADQSGDVYRMMAEATAFYCLFPSSSSIGPARKQALVEEVLIMGPDLGMPQKDRWDLLLQAFEGDGIGSTGTAYNTARDNQIAMYLAFAMHIKQSELSSMAQVEPRDAVNAALSSVFAVRNYRPNTALNILLHLLWPDEFEGTASNDQKKRIAGGLSEAFGLTPLDDVDDTIQQARRHMEGVEGFPSDFNMYSPKVRELWDVSKAAGIKTDINAAKAGRAYEVSKSFHDAVLVQGTSFLWPDERIWNPDNVLRAFDVLDRAWRTGELTTIDQIAPLLYRDSETSFKIGFDVQIADMLRRDQRHTTALGYLNRFRSIEGSPEPDQGAIDIVLEVANYRTPGSQNFRSNAPLEYYLVVFGGLLTLIQSPSIIGNRDSIY